MSHVVEDVRYGLRSLLRNPRFSVLACLLLAAGIGLNTTIFSVVNAVLLRPLPFKDADRLVLVFAKRTESPVSYPVSPAEFWDWKQQNHVFDDMAGFASGHPALLVREETQIVRRTLATASLFPMLGVQPQFGRLFNASEELRGDQVAILTNGFWMRAFGGNPNVVGTSITLDGGRYAVAGILPADFNFFTSTDVWTLVNLPRQMRERRSVGVIAKLRPGVSMEQAGTEMNGIVRQLEQAYPKTNKGYTSSVILPMRDRFVYKVRSSLLILWAAVGAVLLIVCGNVSSLQLARSEARYKEMAIRASMGADQYRIVQQLIIESALIAFAGGALGALLSIAGVRFLAHGPADLPRSAEIHIDPATLLFCFGASALAALLCGISPALKTSKADLTTTLKESGRSTGPGWGPRGFLGGLVILQTALTLVLVAGAGLLVRSFANMQNVDPGFRSQNLSTIGLKLPKERYVEPFSQTPVLTELQDRMQALPGVDSVGAISSLPIIGQAPDTVFNIQNRSLAPTDTVQYRFITPSYFTAMKIPLVKGRVFTAGDHRSAAPVCLINRTFAQRYWPNEDPVGQSIQLPARLLPGAPWMQIAGIVGDVRQIQLTAEPAPEIYIPILQYPGISEMTFVIRTRGPMPDLAGDVRRIIRGVDPGLPLSALEPMDSILARSMAGNRFSATVLAAFAAFALLLAATGMYGLVSYAVSRRTRDMGVRLALGATSGDLVGLVVGQGTVLGGIGIVIGLLATLASGRVVASLLYEVKPFDPGILAAVVLIVAAVIVLACYFPARRAGRIDPISALRYE
jgi:putative ABC transport system permease protein